MVTPFDEKIDLSGSEKDLDVSTASTISYDSKEDSSYASNGPTPQDSRDEVSTASIHTPKHIPKMSLEAQASPLEEYPDDLNPFGSDEEIVVKKSPIPPEVAEAQPHESASANIKENESEINEDTNKASESPKKVIKVNINPFESDEDEIEEEIQVVKDKDKENQMKKNLNPFWSDDDEENSSPSKPKPPRPPPPSVSRTR